MLAELTNDLFLPIEPYSWGHQLKGRVVIAVNFKLALVQFPSMFLFTFSQKASLTDSRNSHVILHIQLRLHHLLAVASQYHVSIEYTIFYITSQVSQYSYQGLSTFIVWTMSIFVQFTHSISYLGMV